MARGIGGFGAGEAGGDRADGRGGMNTETIDRLFLELSQFTTATTKREIELRGLNAELLEALLAVKAEIMEPQLTGATWIKVETAIAKAEELR
jgi:hypothetical protein